METPNLTGINPVHNLRWTLTLPCNGKDMIYYLSTGCSNRNNFADTFFPVNGRPTPVWIPKHAPTGNWAKTLLEARFIGRDLMFSFVQARSGFKGVGWYERGYDGTAALFDQIKEKYNTPQLRIGKTGGQYTCGEITAFSVAQDLHLVDITICPSDGQAFLPFWGNHPTQARPFGATVPLEERRVTYQFPLRVTHWSMMAPFDFAGEDTNRVYTRADCRSDDRECWLSIMPFLAKFESWETVQQSACIGGEFWRRPDLLVLRTFAFNHDFSETEGFIPRTTPLQPCNIWQLKRVHKAMITAQR